LFTLTLVVCVCMCVSLCVLCVCVFLRFSNKMLTDLPLACLYCVSTFLSPRDVAQAECVSRACREMFGCDAVWERFLPAAYEDVLASATQFPPDLLSKKAVFLHLSRGVLLHDGTQVTESFLCLGS
jgi:hypothetical protein